jgi:UDP-N-acetylmuramate--alanine ligase
VLVVTDVYPAREEPIQGITGELIVNAAKQYGHKDVHYISDKKNLPQFLKTIAKENDLVVTMGAGDVWKCGMEFINLLNTAK